MNDLLIIMGASRCNHYLGLVFFDEIQDLSEAKSGGAAQMLNFFRPNGDVLAFLWADRHTKARVLFEGEFRQARRISEQGDFWRPMRGPRSQRGPVESRKADPDGKHLSGQSGSIGIEEGFIRCRALR